MKLSFSYENKDLVELAKKDVESRGFKVLRSDAVNQRADYFVRVDVEENNEPKKDELNIFNEAKMLLSGAGCSVPDNTIKVVIEWNFYRPTLSGVAYIIPDNPNSYEAGPVDPEELYASFSESFNMPKPAGSVFFIVSEYDLEIRQQLKIGRKK